MVEHLVVPGISVDVADMQVSSEALALNLHKLIVEAKACPDFTSEDLEALKAAREATRAVAQVLAVISCRIRVEAAHG